MALFRQYLLNRMDRQYLPLNLSTQASKLLFQSEVISGSEERVSGREETGGRGWGQESVVDCGVDYRGVKVRSTFNFDFKQGGSSVNSNRNSSYISK